MKIKIDYIFSIFIIIAIISFLVLIAEGIVYLWHSIIIGKDNMPNKIYGMMALILSAIFLTCNFIWSIAYGLSHLVDNENENDRR
jgi:hypothetical protein